MASCKLQMSKLFKIHEDFFTFSEEYDFFAADVQKGTFKQSKLKKSTDLRIEFLLLLPNLPLDSQIVKEQSITTKALIAVLAG